MPLTGFECFGTTVLKSFLSIESGLEQVGKTDCGLLVRISSLYSVSLSLYCLKRIENPCHLLVVLNANIFSGLNGI